LRLRRLTYDRTALQQWTTRIGEQPWKEAYVFLKHEEGSPTGPGLAQEMKQLTGDPSRSDEHHDLS
jgi:hypothetical protein